MNVSRTIIRLSRTEGVLVHTIKGCAYDRCESNMWLYVRLKGVHTIKGCLYDNNSLYPHWTVTSLLFYHACDRVCLIILCTRVRLSCSHHILLIAIDNIVVLTMRVLTWQPLEGIVWSQRHRHRVALLKECELSGQIEGVVRILAHQGGSCNGAFSHNLQP